MKNTFLILIGMLFMQSLMAQQEQVISPSNRSAVSLEKNVLFYAPSHFKVTQSGSTSLDLNLLFDGNFIPSYSTSAIDPNKPYVLLIENLPNAHVQVGGWIGWTTRHFMPSKFKIEVSTLETPGQWLTVADVDNYKAGHYISSTPSVTIDKIKLTVYRTNDVNNFLGLSEFFFLNPEYVKAYDRLMVQYNKDGNVGIGTWKPDEKLSVNGKIRAHEIKVETANWPDYVFEKDYDLPDLGKLKDFVQTNKHLPEVPTAASVEQDGIALGELNKILLKKIEELTLYLIHNDEKMKEYKQLLKEQGNKIEQLEEKLK
ncbi:hypothetical protein [Sphingobacterium faecium]